MSKIEFEISQHMNNQENIFSQKKRQSIDINFEPRYWN